MYEEYEGIYDRRFWINRIETLLHSLNELAEPKYDRKNILKSCSTKNELECIKLYFEFRKKYIDLHKLVFPLRNERYQNYE